MTNEITTEWDIELAVAFVVERERLNPYQRLNGPHFTDLFVCGASCMWLPITERWGIKLFHQDRTEILNEPCFVASAAAQRAYQQRCFEAGLATEPGPEVQLTVLNRLYDGYWVRTAQPVPLPRYEAEIAKHADSLRRLGWADPRQSNCGLVDDQFVLLDFSHMERNV